MIKKIEINEIPHKQKLYDQLQRQLRAFWESGWEACEVDPKNYKNHKSCYNAWRKAVQRSGYAIKAVYRDDRVFLVRKADA